MSDHLGTFVHTPRRYPFFEKDFQALAAATAQIQHLSSAGQVRQIPPQTLANLLLGPSMPLLQGQIRDFGPRLGEIASLVVACCSQCRAQLPRQGVGFSSVGVELLIYSGEEGIVVEHDVGQPPVPVALQMSQTFVVPGQVLNQLSLDLLHVAIYPGQILAQGYQVPRQIQDLQ